MSRLLYPDQLELGLVPALRACCAGCPPSIATRLTVSDAVRSVDDPTGSRLTVSERLLAVRVVEEAVSNALKHGPATSIAVDLDVAQDVLHVSVRERRGAVRPGGRGPAVGHRPAGHAALLRGGPAVADAGPGEGRSPRGVAAPGGGAGVAAGASPGLDQCPT